MQDERRGNETNLGRRVVEQDFQVLDAEVGDAYVFDLAGPNQLLHLLPCLDKVPVWQVLLQIGRVGRARPVHDCRTPGVSKMHSDMRQVRVWSRTVEVDIVGPKGLQRGVNALLDSLVPRVVELGCQPNVPAGHAGVLDSQSNFGFIAIG